MKKNIISILALVLALVSLGMSVLGMNREETDYSGQIAALEQENQQLRAQLQQLTARLDEQEATSAAGGLASWTMDITPWEDSTGADILLTAVPESYHEALTARLVVQKEGVEILSAPCEWDGTSFTVTAPLSAADGYGYYLVMELGNDQQTYPLTNPNNPVLDIPVYLASSLTTYCNLIVDGWAETDEGITLNAAYIHVQLPRLSAEVSATVESARLVLTHNGAEVHDIPLTLQPGETADSHELALTGITLPLPETAADDLLELQLEVKLSGGSLLTASGITWFRNGDALDAVVG